MQGKTSGTKCANKAKNTRRRRLKLKTYDNFGPATDLTNVDTTTGAWETEVYKLIYFQLKGGFWLNTHVTNSEDTRIAEHRCISFAGLTNTISDIYTVDTLREARKLLYTAILKCLSHHGCSSSKRWCRIMCLNRTSNLALTRLSRQLKRGDLLYSAIHDSSVAFSNILQSMMDEIRLHHNNKHRVAMVVVETSSDA